MSDSPSLSPERIAEMEAASKETKPVIRSSSALFARGACCLCGYKPTAIGRGRNGAKGSHYSKHLRAGHLRRRATPEPSNG